jgi:hypothetical protein
LDQLSVALRPLSPELLPRPEGMVTLEPEEDEAESAEEELQES